MANAKRALVLGFILIMTGASSGCFVVGGALGMKPEQVNHFNFPFILGDMVGTGGAYYAARIDSSMENDTRGDVGGISTIIGLFIGPLIGVIDKIIAKNIFGWEWAKDRQAEAMQFDSRMVPEPLWDAATPRAVEKKDAEITPPLNSSWR